MSIYQFDPIDWLVSVTRALEDYIKAALDLDFYEVEMSYPDPEQLVKPNPAQKVLVHVERDDVSSPEWAFGVQGVDEWSDPEHLSGTFRVLEAHRRVVNFDIGVWATADAGGETMRMRAVQLLHDLFGPNGSRQAFNFDTGGITVTSFDGGSDVTDRISDVPVWRTIDMTLVLEVFSKSTPEPLVVPESFDQTPTLDILP
jgi:hypothetical protein